MISFYLLVASLPFLFAQTGNVVFSTSPSFMMSYSIANDTISMTLIANNSGYLAIGFGSLNMNNADCTYLAFNNGVGIVEDGFSTSNGKPAAYAVSHTKIVSSIRTGGASTFKVERKLNPGLSKTYTIDPNSDVKMIWALGRSDTYDEHFKEGSLTVNFGKNITSSSKRLAIVALIIVFLFMLF
jgi:DOMON domain